MATSNLKPVAGRSVLITKRGATVNGTFNDVATITVHCGALGFAVGDTVCPEDDASKYTTVASVTNDTTLVLSKKLVLADGVRLLNLGTDTASGSTLDYDGYSGSEFIYTTPAGSDVVPSNTVTTDADGEAEFYAAASRVFDQTVLDTDGALSANSQTTPDVAMPGDNSATVAPDSGTSQQGAINSAIDSVNAAGGGIVNLLPGTYTVDGAVVAKANVWLRGSGMNNTILKMKASTTASVIEQTGASAVAFFRLSDLTIDGNDVNSAVAAGTDLRNCSTLLIENVEVKDCDGIGIGVKAADVSTDRVTIRDCYVHDVCSGTATTADGGIVVNRTSPNTIDDVIVTGNTLEDIGDGNSNAAGQGINVLCGSVSTLVNGNVLRTVRLNGIRVSIAGKCVISANSLTDCGASNATDGGNAIFTTAVDNVVVNDNYINGIAAASDNGIECTGTGADNVTIAGNDITGVANSGKSAVSVSGEKVVVSANNCHDNTGGGIYAKTSSGTAKKALSVTGNVCDTNGNHGINVRGWTHVAVSGNVCRGNTGASTAGIAIYEGLATGSVAGQTTITGNVCSSNGSDGLEILGEVVGADGDIGVMVVVDGNIIDTNGDYGIRIKDIDGVCLSANVVASNSESGVLIDDCDDIAISGNVIKANGTGVSGTSDDDGIRFAGTCDNVTIDGNIVADHSAAGQWGITVGAATLTNIRTGYNNSFINNDGNITGTTMHREPVDTLADDGTPDVGGGHIFKTGGTTAITDFDNGVVGQELVILAEHSVTVTYNGAFLLLAGATDYTMTAGDTLTLKMFNSQAWHEVARSVN